MKTQEFIDKWTDHPGQNKAMARDIEALVADRLAALQAEETRLWAVYQEVYAFLETEGFLNMGPHPPTPYEKKVSELEHKLIALFNEKAVWEEK